MPTPAHSGTPGGDIAVDVRGVVKVYRQRQRGATVRDAVRSLVRPRIKEVRALDGVDLSVRRGEIVAYAGPNGAGKSTTIKLLSGLLSPDAGAVRVLGMDPARERTRYVSRIGVVFGQRTELWWDHPVAASFDWKRVVWNVPRDRYDHMLGLARELLGLDEFFHSSARELSLGQKMRAEIGLALVHDPEILFLDEPTIGLDVLAKRRLLQFVKDLNAARGDAGARSARAAGSSGVTVMVTSHDMSDLEQLAGRIVMIDRGKIAFDGDFAGLRALYPQRRHLLLETAGDGAPALDGAELVSSDAGRHEYRFSPSETSITALLDQANARAHVLDVETHRPDIEEVIAAIYERWTAPQAGTSSSSPL